MTVGKLYNEVARSISPTSLRLMCVNAKLRDDLLRNSPLLELCETHYEFINLLLLCLTLGNEATAKQNKYFIAVFCSACEPLQ